MNLWIPPLAIAFLAGLLYAERKDSLPGVLLTKPFLSALFIVTLLLQSYTPAPFFYFILAGQVFCFIGDVCLIFFFQKNIFMIGLAAFLTGHILYTIAFFSLGGVNALTWLAALAISLISGFVFLQLKPNLGNLLAPVVAYIVVISVMTTSALSLAGNSALPAAGRIMVSSGALGFYFSDIFVARQRFVRQNYINRLFGLPLYYLAQFLIAFAARAVRL